MTPVNIIYHFRLEFSYRHMTKQFPPYQSVSCPLHVSEKHELLFVKEPQHFSKPLPNAPCCLDVSKEHPTDCHLNCFLFCWFPERNVSLFFCVFFFFIHLSTSIHFLTLYPRIGAAWLKNMDVFRTFDVSKTGP